jgi:hypothetical protein
VHRRNTRSTASLMQRGTIKHTNSAHMTFCYAERLYVAEADAGWLTRPAHTARVPVATSIVKACSTLAQAQNSQHACKYLYTVQNFTEAAACEA